MAAFSIGVVIAPRRLWRAFVRGRRSRTLYGHGWSDEYLAWRLDEMRTFLGLGSPPQPATISDRVAFVLWTLPVLGVVAAIVTVATILI